MRVCFCYNPADSFHQKSYMLEIECNEDFFGHDQINFSINAVGKYSALIFSNGLQKLKISPFTRIKQFLFFKDKTAQFAVHHLPFNCFLSIKMNIDHKKMSNFFFSAYLFNPNIEVFPRWNVSFLP